MGFRTPQEFLDSLRDGRQVWVNGTKIDDLVTHPLTRRTAEQLSQNYLRYHDPATRDIFVTEDPETGEPVDRFMVMPRNTDDLLARARAIDFTIRYGGPSFGSDALLSFLWVAPELEKANPRYRENVTNAYRRFRDENLTMAIVMSDTKGDRSKHPSQQLDPDLYVHVVDRRPDGVVIRGMKAHISGAAFVDELMVMPTKRMRDDEQDYAIGCMVATNSPGVKIIARAAEEKSRFDYPLSWAGGPEECFVWFDDVFVPHERIFQNGENWISGPIAYALGLWERYSAMCYKKPTVELLAGAASLMANMNGIAGVPHIQEKLFEFALLAQSLEAFITAAAVACEVREGVAIPNQAITNIGKYMFASKYHELVKHVLDISGAIVATAPKDDAFHSPELHAAFEKYLGVGEQRSGEERLRLINFIRDLCADEYAGWKSVLTLHGEGSMAAQKMMTMRSYDFGKAEEYVKRIAGIGVPESERLSKPQL